jgi:hypothetical protein
MVITDLSLLENEADQEPATFKLAMPIHRHSPFVIPNDLHAANIGA